MPAPENTKNLPDFRACDIEDFNRAIAKYHAGTSIEALPDQELWILYTKWLEVDSHVDARTSYGWGLRFKAIKYRDDLKAECMRRGLLT